MEFGNMEIIESLLDSGRDVTAYFAHCGNWEWVTSITLHSRTRSTDTRYCQIYRPLNNRGFDAPHARHTQPIRYVVDSQKHGIRTLLRLRRSGIRTVTGF